jgi:hypothetical protein
MFGNASRMQEARKLERNEWREFGRLQHHGVS